ncbi:MAG: ATP-binding protein [Bacteroides sp.]|nr:ATP-binding protein [Bacteroides sp.]
MTELSLNVLDVVQNSIRAKASLTVISVEIHTDENSLVITIEDNGAGMDKETLSRAADPFFTTRSTRKTGLGLPFFKMSAESTGGSFAIASEKGKGTRVTARYVLDSADRMPLGDMPSVMEALALCNTDIDFVYNYSVDGEGFTFDTVKIKEILEGVPLTAPEVKKFIREFLRENTDEINKKKTF